MKKLAGHWQILLALLLSTLTAIAFRGLFGGEAAPGSFVARAIETSEFIGDLFLRALKMIIVPLIVTSVVSGIASLQGVKGFGRLGMKTFGFYACSTLLAVLTGLVLVNLIEPGIRDGAPNLTIREAFEQRAEGASEAQKTTVATAAQKEGKDFLETIHAHPSLWTTIVSPSGEGMSVSLKRD